MSFAAVNLGDVRVIIESGAGQGKDAVPLHPEKTLPAVIMAVMNITGKTRFLMVGLLNDYTRDKLRIPRFSLLRHPE